MMYRIFAAALAAGVLAAVLITALQAATTLPMILQAESLESSAPAMDHNAASMGDAPAAPTGHDHGDGTAWAPANGSERLFATLLANCATGIAFALLLVVGLTIGARKADISKALLLAGAGFSAFTLAPSLGLPPELPGMPTADLVGRQVWWAITVAATTGGLACFAYTKPLGLKVLGVALLIAPHTWGPPPLMTDHSLVPAALAANFAATSIALSAVLWGLIGVFAAQFYARFAEKS